MLGLLDSGLGGLTVAAAIARRMPQLSFTYRADHAYAPYGGRTRGEILERVTDELGALFDAGCRLVVFACNTASASALRDIQQNVLPTRWPGRNAIGVVVPVVEAMAALLPDRTVRPDAPVVQVFATDHTVRSQVFVTEIYKRAPGLRVMQTACSELASAIEKGAQNLSELVQQYASVALQQCPHPDYVILGCTHYPLIRDLFARALPNVPILDEAEAVAASLESYLARHPEYAMDYSGQHRFVTTGDPDAVNAAAAPYFARLGLVGAFGR
jgi:glutamate racemase